MFHIIKSSAFAIFLVIFLDLSLADSGPVLPPNTTFSNESNTLIPENNEQLKNLEEVKKSKR